MAMQVTVPRRWRAKNTEVTMIVWLRTPGVACHLLGICVLDDMLYHLKWGLSSTVHFLKLLTFCRKRLEIDSPATAATARSYLRDELLYDRTRSDVANAEPTLPHSTVEFNRFSALTCRSTNHTTYNRCTVGQQCTHKNV